jgi:uncharacterized protein
MRAQFLAALLAGALLAGCAADGGPPGGEGVEASATPRLASLREVLPFEALSPDGTALRGHVYLPDTPAPYATVLEYSPYWNTQNGDSALMAAETDDGRTSMELWFAPYLDAGFAVALVNARGFGVSDGCTDFGGVKESQDIRATVDALAGQPWSTGNVGMVGLSYPAWMQYIGLRDPSPHLKTIIPVSGIIDYYSLTQRHGAVMTVGPALSGIIAALSLTPGTQVAETGELGQTNPTHHPCVSLAQGQAEDLKRAAVGDRNPFWDERDYRAMIPASGIPMLVTNGILPEGEGHILQVDDLWATLPAGSRMLIGYWQHGYPGGEWLGPIPEYQGPVYSELAVAWMDHHLRGGPAVPAGFVEYEDTDHAMHTAPSWPPPGGKATLHLTARGVLGAAAGPSAEQSFVSADTDPVSGPCPATQATYVSPPLAEDALLAGYFVANLTLSSTAPDGNLVVKLWHGEPGAACMDGDAREVARANTDLRHRGHLARGVDFSLTEPGHVDVRSYPMAVPVKAGERLILVVAGGSEELFPDQKPALTVHSGAGGAGGSITIDVAEGQLRFADEGGSAVLQQAS